jgi:hypothetical protein
VPHPIRAAAFCPHPPLLVPAVGAGEPVAVREPALEAVRALLATSIDQVVVIGAHAGPPTTFPAGATGSFAGYGVDLRVHLPGAAPAPDVTLPLALAVGAWLLDAAGWTGPTVGLACDHDGNLPATADRPTGLLVMGDGSARRTEKAPGWLDERAAGFDAGVAKALGSGEPDALRTDLTLGADLLAAGAPVWTAAAALLAGREWRAALTYDEAPYGVGYFVAEWSAAGSD